MQLAMLCNSDKIFIVKLRSRTRSSIESVGGLLRDTDTEITITSHKLPGQGESSFDAWMCKIQPKHLLSSSSPSQSPGSSRLGAGGLMRHADRQTA